MHHYAQLYAVPEIRPKDSCIVYHLSSSHNHCGVNFSWASVVCTPFSFKMIVMMIKLLMKIVAMVFDDVLKL